MVNHFGELHFSLEDVWVDRKESIDFHGIFFSLLLFGEITQY